MNGDQPLAIWPAREPRSAEQILGFRRGGGAGRGRLHELDARGLPHLEEQHGDDEGQEGRGHVDQPDLDVVRPVELHRGERSARDEQRRQHLEGALPAGHGPHQPDRQDQRERRQDPSGHRRQLELGQAGDAVQRADRVADAAPRDRRGVGDQAEDRRLERLEAEPDQEGAGDGHRRAAAAGAFQERAEAEGDEHGLDPAIGRQPRDRALHHRELPGLHRDVVEEDRRDDDPGDAEEAEDDAGHHRAAGQLRRHAEDRQRQGDGHDHAGERGHPDARPEGDEHEEEGDDGEGGDGGRQRPRTERVVVLAPGHGLSGLAGLYPSGARPCKKCLSSAENARPAALPPPAGNEAYPYSFVRDRWRPAADSGRNPC